MTLSARRALLFFSVCTKAIYFVVITIFFVFSHLTNGIITSFTMKTVEFKIPYHIEDGGSIQVAYQLEGADDSEIKTFPLSEVLSGEWSGHIEVADDADAIRYGYEYVRNGRVVRGEWGGKPHSLHFNCINSRYMQFDLWLDSPAGYYATTGLFGMFSNIKVADNRSGVNWYNRSVTVQMFITGVENDSKPLLAGDVPVLGMWNPDEAPLMHCIAPNLWSATFDVEGINSGCIRFKVVLRHADGTLQWEGGDNRTITLPDFEPGTACRYSFDPISFAQPTLRLAGTVIPLFSIRTERSWGIGDFGDLKAMADWLELTGQNVLQLLPVNDTTVTGGDGDSYPYNCVSVFALNPIYTDMESLPKLDSAKRNAYYSKQRMQLNELPKVDYSAVFMLKMNYLRELFAQQGDETLATDECRAFVAEQERWLQPYTLFRFLSSRLHCDISRWGEYSCYDATTKERVLAEFSDAEGELQFYTFVQYILYRQLCDAHSYANSKRVALKGDIPIGVAPNGLDVWCDREQFNLTVSAGAPPDAFAAEGQNWGFPTYNWKQMEADGYEWWRRRLQYMSRFFDAYRIDHILGFFRIWQIPRWAVSGLAGTFSPSVPMSAGEIESAGFALDADLHTRAFVDGDTVSEIFGDMEEFVHENYLNEYEFGCYTFKDEFRDPLALRAHLYSAYSPLSYEMKEEVLRLFGEVLFFKDAEGFTPRIDASRTLAYSMLSVRDRAAYNRLYEEYFYHRHTNFWYEEGMRKLMPVLLSTPMTACGEDLGMIPECVPWVMRNLQILSLEIERMPKRYGEVFALPQNYPYLSVATPSTHDMSTLRGWWCEDSSATQRFYNEVLQRSGDAPATMSGEIAATIVRSHLEAPSMLALFAWQDLMAMDERLRRDNPDDERINVPANRDHVWCYRMHITVEQMMKESAFNNSLYSMIAASGRIAKVQ